MMKQDNIIDNIDLLALAEDLLDILCELPEEEIRRKLLAQREYQKQQFDHSKEKLKSRERDFVR